MTVSSDRDRALDLCPSLRAIIPELEIYERLLRQWQPKINLVSDQTLPELWTRHFADSAQILDQFPGATRWADLGSGAGFPGMVLALLLKSRPGAIVHLIESDQRKAAFLRAVSRETGAPTLIHCARISRVLPKLAGEIDAISARALAPLADLVAWSRELLLKNAVGAFLKGEDWRDELTAVSAADSLEFNCFASVTHPAARVITVVSKSPTDRKAPP
ncbi:MAG TPA: 16S rRNA (guanine(527)-N(7))-methyltransferase RsmG [Methylocystis sp.]|nr:16S rRNA (guanine(527)-N(7))-methyltransferase RsmG [Methylocystis sp.]